MTNLKSVLNSPYFFWTLLTLPAIGTISAAFAGADLEEMLHPTGEFSARFMIIAMMLTPLRMICPKARPIRWLMQRRRYLGVAAFGYAALHTLYYMLDLGSLSAVAAEFTVFGIWTGWLAFVIFVPLALTSNNASIRALGRQWKTLQRFVYPAAVATLLHWIFIEYELGPALAHFVPLAALEWYRIKHNLRLAAVAQAREARQAVA